VIAEAGLEATAARLFAGGEPVSLLPAELRPTRPFEGRLFDLVAALGPGDVVGLVVGGLRWRPSAAPAVPVLAVADHVNLGLRGPLTGRWPAGVPRSFPCVTGIYQPAVVRAGGGPSVYSQDVVAAGVADAARLTPFERRALEACGAQAVSDSLVPAAVAAAFYGLKVAAGVVTPAARERE
jgi:purine nucleoside phosphorylase